GRVPELVRDRPDARLQPLDDPLRRGSLHAGQTRRPRARTADQNAVPRRRAESGAVPRFGRGDSARGARTRARRPVLHEHARRAAPRAPHPGPAAQGHAADHHDHRRQAVGADAARRPHLQERLRSRSVHRRRNVRGGGRVPQERHHDQHLHARARLRPRQLRPPRRRDLQGQGVLHDAVHPRAVRADGLHGQENEDHPLAIKASAMSELLPLFPLPNVVLFPNVFLPLHIFEPRYREMVADAIASDRLIGMVLLRPGWRSDYEGRPPVYPIGCSGVMTHVERLADGRYNIVLRGVERFRVLEEDHAKSYRRAIVQPLPERPPAAADRDALRTCRAKLESLLTPADRASADVKMPAAMADEDLVNALAQYLDFEPLEKQALLEHDGLRSRAQTLVELLEMKMLALKVAGGGSTLAH